MLSPKKVKYRKQQKGRMRGMAHRGAALTFGEVGLAGEIRPVPNGIERLKEAAKHGFKRAIVPASNAPKKNEIEGMEIIPEVSISMAQ